MRPPGRRTSNTLLKQGRHGGDALFVGIGSNEQQAAPGCAENVSSSSYKVEGESDDGHYQIYW